MSANLNGDLDGVLAETQGLWEDLRGARIFITGGTSFVGAWLLESFSHANKKLALRAKAEILSRHAEVFLAKHPHLAQDDAFIWRRADVNTFPFPKAKYSHIIHAATPSGIGSDRDRPGLKQEIVRSARHVLELAKFCGARQFLFVSSGAVYGKQLGRVTHREEESPGGPLTPDSAYGEGKLVAERLCADYAREWGFQAKIARGFSFLGPYLALDAQLASGNFIRDALRGRAIEIQGDGTPLRSYLYGADLAAWLWTILLRGENSRPYNVGSERSMSILELARMVGRVLKPGIPIHIQQKPVPGKPADNYVPSTHRAQTELGLSETIEPEEAIRRTALWNS